MATARRLRQELQGGHRSSPGSRLRRDQIDRPALARARPESVRLTETYFYKRVIARHHVTEEGQAPTGRIRAVIPYDGHRYFGREAYEDVQRQLGTTAPAGAQAMIGHLTLVNDGRTDLARQLDLAGSFGSVPLVLPLTNKDIGYPGWLRADRHACVVEYRYRPDGPHILPVDVDMQLLDEGSETPTGEPLEGLAQHVAQSGSFHPDLLLQVDVVLQLPSELERPSPRITRMTLDWPTITSMRGLRLTVNDRPYPLRYDPATRSLSWTGVPITAVGPEADEAEVRTDHSGPMLLAIHQPGELYQRDSLRGRVEVEIPDRLLSGLQARLYDGTGRLSEEPTPKLSTRLVADVRLILDEAFAGRKLTPYQFLHFDEVIPDTMRLGDIRAALHDRGFRVEETRDVPGAEHDDLNYRLKASRPHGAHTMRLWLLVEGQRYKTERQTRLPGGVLYTSTSESGELRIHMRGELPGDGEGAIHEMNDLQVALRDRFERLRAKR